MRFLLVCLIGLLVSVEARPISSPVISGQVRLPNGSPVAGAQVVLFDLADLSRGAVGQATTDEAGQFALPLTAAGGSSVLPQEVALGANYPNPFNPSTIIPYQLAATSPVRLEVFNILGQRVATLVDEEQQAGSYRARWDGTDAAGRAAAAGVYFYRLTVAGAHQTGKMVLMDGQAGVPLGGPSVVAVPQAGGWTGSYGLVVSGEGLVAYVDSDFGVGLGPVDLVVSAAPQGQGKVVVPSLAGVLGDVDDNGQVDMDDGLLVAMQSVHPGLSLSHPGPFVLGDVNCDGRVEVADAELIAAFVANPSDPAVSSLRIGQPGGYSLDPVTEVVWGSILGNEKQDAVVTQILAGVPVLLSGVVSFDGEGQLAIGGEDRLYLGIDRDYWTAHGGKQLYAALKQRFPVTPIHVEPSIGVVRQAGKRRRAKPVPIPSARTPAALRRTGPPLSFSESPHAAFKGTTKQQHVVGQITVPDDVTVGTVAVAVDISHPFKSDLKIDLVAPSGVVTTLYDGVQTGINSEANLVGELPVTTALQGQAAGGTWQLRVGDYEREDTGTLNSWRLSITPASATQETQEPANLFLDTFQEGLGAWDTSQWEAASLETDATIPGEGPGNIVAKAQGCAICFMTLQTPIDLSAHESVTLSFYRWLDPGAGNTEFLGVDIGNGGTYRRLANWSGRDADGQWHRETYTLSGDQISDTFSLRFFGITNNALTTFAIDNVMISATPGSVIVEPVEPEEEITERPDLAVTLAIASPRSATSGDTISFFTRVVNRGDAPAPAGTLTAYRHEAPTETPTQGGVVAGTRDLLAVANGRSVVISLKTTAPAVTQTKRYFYYLCADVTVNETVTENNCHLTPADITVHPGETMPEPEEPETPETPEEPGASLTVTRTAATPTTLQSTYPITLQTTITNTGDATAAAQTIRIYRHTRATNMPARDGTEEPGTATTGTLAPGASITVTSTHAAPTVTQTTRYYYYVCVADTCTNDPAEVIVRVKPEDPGGPYESCPRVPERSTPMGGDTVRIQPDDEIYITSCSTITLGGLETRTGERGFVLSGHAAAGAFEPKDFTRTDAFVGHGKDEKTSKIKHFLGRLFRTPIPETTIRIGTFGERQVIYADAAFAVYPTAAKPRCSLTWESNLEAFCLDPGHDDYLDRLAPLSIRGAGDDVYTVIGSREPTEGLAVLTSGAVSRTPTQSEVLGNTFLFPGSNLVVPYTYSYDTLGESSRGGDSGAPVYTVPDADGTTYIVGVHYGNWFRGGRRVGTSFSSWNGVMKELDLKPISAPAGPAEEDEADLAELFSAFD